MVEEAQAGLKSKKRGRPSAGTPANGTKRRRNESHPASETPPASTRAWKPPTGSWEDAVDSIDACHDEDTGKLIIFLTWKGGQKTQHDTKVVYARCPQKVRTYGQAKDTHALLNSSRCICPSHTPFLVIHLPLPYIVAMADRIRFGLQRCYNSTRDTSRSSLPRVATYPRTSRNPREKRSYQSEYATRVAHLYVYGNLGYDGARKEARLGTGRILINHPSLLEP